MKNLGIEACKEVKALADENKILRDALLYITVDAPESPVFASQYTYEDGVEFYGRDSMHYMLAQIARKALGIT